MTKKVLVIEDDEMIRKLILLTLQEDGCELHEAADGVAGLEMIHALKPDLVIVDVLLPGKNGYQLCEEIRRDPELDHAYVIFVSGRNINTTEPAVLEAGGDLLIPKPFKPDQIRQAVKRGLARSSSE